MKKIYIVSVFAILQLSCTDFMNLFHSYNYGSQDFEDIDPKLKEELTKRFNLPPDPGEEGKKTLFGIDADKDGLRDDVQRWIYFHYPEDPLIRNALIQYAKDQMDRFKYVNDKKKSIEYSHLLRGSIECQMEIFRLVYSYKDQKYPVDYNGHRSLNAQKNMFEHLQVNKIIENTTERFNASRKSDSNASGQAFGSNGEAFSTCRFKVDHPKLEDYLNKNKR